ncbi:hypothetical protein [Simkania sp.]|uniref:hypothetical protein n=1 Tax=Simkania sp. TaxID=34094 RepID=UPI003B51925D
MSSGIPNVNQLVCGSSPDSVAAAAALMRTQNGEDWGLEFSLPNQVGRIGPKNWSGQRHVGILGLAVNNDSRSNSDELTIEFINSIHDEGHKIEFIFDEHGKGSWEEVLKKSKVDPENVTILTTDRSERSSTCAILKDQLGEIKDQTTLDLLEAGNQADQLKYTELGDILIR